MRAKRRSSSSLPPRLHRSLQKFIFLVVGLALFWFISSSLVLHLMLSNRSPSQKGNSLQKRRLRRLSDNPRQPELKEAYNHIYPPSDTHRIRLFVEQELRIDDVPTVSNMPYDIHNCPSTPPRDYPMEWNIQPVLQNWNPNKTSVPQKIYQGLCVFDFNIDYEKALNYRNAEVPFVVSNTPVIWQTAERWNRDPDYLLSLLGDEQQKTEHAWSRHFMYWKIRGSQPYRWKPPTDLTKLSYKDWYQKAQQQEQQTRQSKQEQEELWYFRLNAQRDGNLQMHEYLYDELPWFETRVDSSFFMVEPKEQRGINCRFGMSGIIAEAHFDSSRNFITVLGGQRRYILAHPKECEHLQLYPRQHPSGRHSSVDWTDTELLENSQDTSLDQFRKLQVNEVLLQAGDALYLPTHWFHFIVSLTTNFQCNARSGATDTFTRYIRKCGF